MECFQGIHVDSPECQDKNSQDELFITPFPILLLRSPRFLGCGSMLRDLSFQILGHVGTVECL